MRRYIIKATNNFELETNELLEAQKVLANESTKNFNETFTVIRIDGNNEKILVQGKVIEPEEQKKLSDFIWNYKKEKCEMIKLIVRDKEIGGEKKLVEVNNISNIATIKFDEEDEEVTYQYCNIDINNPKLENSKHLNDIWKNLKDDAKKLTLFEFVDKIFLSQDFIFRLSETYEQDGKLILPIALEPYAEEAIVYVINSCINGKIDGYFKIEKATNDMMRFAKRRNNEMKYLDWKNYIIDMVAHDFHSNGYYGIVAMEKLIKELQNKNLEDAKNKTIDFLFNDEDMLKYIYLSNSMTENKVSLSFYTNSLGDKFIKREPKSIYRDFVIYKNIPVYKMEISASFYKIEIDENGFDVRKELSKEQIELVIGK